MKAAFISVPLSGHQSSFRPRISGASRPSPPVPPPRSALPLLFLFVSVSAFLHAPPLLGPHTFSSSIRMVDDGGGGGKRVAGSFFNPVPEGGGGDGDGDGGENGDGDEKEGGGVDGGDVPSSSSAATPGEEEDAFERSLREMLDKRRGRSNASKPSTVGGVPTSKATGFGKQKASGGKKFSAPVTSNRRDGAAGDTPYVAIGPGGKKLNDVNNPEYDDQGYTLYADEETGERSRVFEALVRYPCEFKVKIVGADEGAFVPEMVALVAESCGVDVGEVKYRERKNGRWTSVTVNAPVQSAEMLYELYENIDRDPRVKFKF